MQGPTNISASFAREAASLLQNNEVQQAMELCMAGIQAFPNYPTGYLVLGKCFESVGRRGEASAQYQEALKRLPDNPTLLAFVKKLDEAQQKEMRQQVEQQQSTTGTAVPPPPPPPQPKEANEETAFDILTKKLRNVKRIQSDASSPPPPPPPAPNNVTFATPTMAEIFVKQGNYAEALAAYKELAARKPDEQYTRRIAELEKLLEPGQKE